MDINNIRIKNITLIPELKVTNNPLYLARIIIPSYEAKIGNRHVGQKNHSVTKDLFIDDKYKKSEWTVSDILGAILTSTWVISSFTPLSFVQNFVKFKEVINTLEKTKDTLALISGAKIINDLIGGSRKENYLHSMQNNNSILILINEKVKRYEDFFSIKEMNFHGERHVNWWFEKTEAEISKMYMKIDFE